MTSLANHSIVSSSLRKPQYVEINQWEFHDYLGDAAWMAERIDDDVIYDARLDSYNLFSDYKKGHLRNDRWGYDLFSNQFRDDVADPLDWWHNVLMRAEFYGHVIQFKTRFNSPYGRRLIPRRTDDIARPEENDWTIMFLVDCRPPLPVPIQIEVCFSLGQKSDSYGRISSRVFDLDEYERVCDCYDRFARVHYSLGVVFACDTPHANAIDEKTGEPIALINSMDLGNTVRDKYPAIYRTNTRVFFRDHVVEPQVKNGKMRYVLEFSGDLSHILNTQRWFHNNSPMGTVAFFRASPDMLLVDRSSKKTRQEWSEEWFCNAKIRIPKKHAYMAERAMVLMHMLLTPFALGERATPALIAATPLVCIKLPVYVLLWIFDWLPEEFGGWNEVAKLRCLTDVQSALRRVLQARPNLESATVSKRTRSAKHQDWV